MISSNKNQTVKKFDSKEKESLDRNERGYSVLRINVKIGETW